MGNWSVHYFLNGILIYKHIWHNFPFHVWTFHATISHGLSAVGMNWNPAWEFLNGGWKLRKTNYRGPLKSPVILFLAVQATIWCIYMKLLTSTNPVLDPEIQRLVLPHCCPTNRMPTHMYPWVLINTFSLKSWKNDLIWSTTISVFIQTNVPNFPLILVQHSLLVYILLTTCSALHAMFTKCWWGHKIGCCLYPH